MQMPRFAIVLLLLSALLLTACPSPTPPVAPPDITTFSADPLTIKLGDSSTLLWAVTGEDVTLRISDGVRNVTGVSETVSPTETTEYTLTATNSGGRDTATVTVTVTVDPPANHGVYSNSRDYYCRGLEHPSVNGNRRRSFSLY